MRFLYGPALPIAPFRLCESSSSTPLPTAATPRTDLNTGSCARPFASMPVRRSRMTKTRPRPGAAAFPPPERLPRRAQHKSIPPFRQSGASGTREIRTSAPSGGARRKRVMFSEPSPLSEFAHSAPGAGRRPPGSGAADNAVRAAGPAGPLDRGPSGSTPLTWSLYDPGPRVAHPATPARAHSGINSRDSDAAGCSNFDCRPVRGDREEGRAGPGPRPVRLRADFRASMREAAE